ncbi:aminotransferase class IV [Postechiella marina]|uniref:branched-chain-amino-acid transaminase n=1 Tax=Postechiella marina TaxID=943941 RepID=A0ABP8CCI0_9FLAO
MINFNENIVDNNTKLSIENRGYTYGDALFETIKVANGKILYWEDHYFRLMASMRIMRMEIPMNFTMEYLQEQIEKTLNANQLLTSSARVKLMVHRNEGGLYLPNTNAVSFIISVKPLDQNIYIHNTDFYEVDLYKDHYLSPSLLSTLKTNNKALNVIGNIYAKENNLNNCFVLNTDKQVVEALNGNVFLIKGNTVKTPPLNNGCLKGVMRKQIIELLEKLPDWELEESPISPFEIQKADEIFITNVIVGVQPVTKYRKKQYKANLSKILIDKLNIKIRLG